jgi:hypothetical protein
MKIGRRRQRALCLGLMATALTSCTPPPATPPNCIDAVRQAENDVRLRIQGGAEEQTSRRAEMQIQLYLAAAAAERGDEQECWRRYQVGRAYIP